MKKKIYKFINNTKKYAPEIAKEIVETFTLEANDDNIDYSFTISGDSGQICEVDPETGEIKETDPNTYFVFDTVEQTTIHDFKKALFNEDLKNIEENSEEEKVLMGDVRNFLLKTCNIINDEYHKQLADTIRRVVLGNKIDNDKVKLETIRVISIDLADYSSIPESSKYLLKIGKVPGSDINTDEIIRLVQNRQEQTGMDIDTIFSIEKKSGNPMFKNVEAIILGKKFLNEISVYFFVDYSISSS